MFDFSASPRLTPLYLDPMTGEPTTQATVLPKTGGAPIGLEVGLLVGIGTVIIGAGLSLRRRAMRHSSTHFR